MRKSAYVRLRAQAGVSSKRRIYSDERLSRAAMVKSQCLPTGEYVSPQDIESGCVAKVLPRTSRVGVLPKVNE